MFLDHKLHPSPHGLWQPHNAGLRAATQEHRPPRTQTTTRSSNSQRHTQAGGCQPPSTTCPASLTASSMKRRECFPTDGSWPVPVFFSSLKYHFPAVLASPDTLVQQHRVFSTYTHLLFPLFPVIPPICSSACPVKFGSDIARDTGELLHSLFPQYKSSLRLELPSSCPSSRSQEPLGGGRLLGSHPRENLGAGTGEHYCSSNVFLSLSSSSTLAAE